MTTEGRGIRIPLKRASWKLIIAALEYVVDKPHLDDLEESREDMTRVLKHLKRKLGEE